MWFIFIATPLGEIVKNGCPGSSSEWDKYYLADFSRYREGPPKTPPDVFRQRKYSAKRGRFFWGGNGGIWFKNITFVLVCLSFVLLGAFLSLSDPYLTLNDAKSPCAGSRAVCQTVKNCV